MMNPPPKLQLPAQLIIWGSQQLTMTEKVVWYHTWFLDQGGADGCYIGAASMGARLGIAPRTVEGARSRLARVGLMQHWARREGIEYGRRATLPIGLREPRTFRDVTAEVVMALDTHIAAVDAGPVRPSGDGPSLSASTPRTGAGAPFAGGAPREGGRGEGAPSASVSTRQLSPAVEDTRRREDAEEGAVSRDREQRGGSERVGDVLRRIGRGAA